MLRIVTIILAFGMFTYFVYNISSLDSYITILDLNTSDLIWTNSMQLTESDPLKESLYSETWSRNMLYYFLKKKTFKGRVKYCRDNN